MLHGIKSRDAFVARELAPAGLRSSPSQAHSINLIHRVAGFQGRFAPQREQAPSPRELGMARVKGMPRVSVSL
ncbi:hypothetical protein SAMN03159302_01019, partial [Pseudomonas sp. NFACC54]